MRVETPVAVVEAQNEPSGSCIVNKTLPKSCAEIARLQEELSVERSAREKAEKVVEDLHRREIYFRHITEYALDLITIMDPEGNILFESRSIQTVLGYPSSEYVGKNAFSFVHPEDVPRVAHAFLEALTGEGNTPELNFRFRHKDGSYRILEGCGNNLTKDPVVKGMVFNSRDITDRKQSERELAYLNEELVKTSRQAGIAEVATGVLHNVGNVFNSVNLAACRVRNRLETSRVKQLSKVVNLLQEHRADLASFLASDPKGSAVPEYLAALSHQLEEEHQSLRKEMDAVAGHVEHIKEIVKAQQSGARAAVSQQALQARDLVEDAIRLCGDELESQGICLQRELTATRLVMVDRHQVLQILVNLLRNASQSIQEAKPTDRRVTVLLVELAG